MHYYLFLFHYLIPITKMTITQRLANLSLPTVIAIISILVVARIVLIRRRFPYAKAIAEIAESLALAIGLVFLLIRPFLAQAFFIPSESMVPTLMVNDHILANKLVYRYSEPKAGDVIIFKSPKSAGQNEADFVKRVIGLPGDRVKITAGYVLADSVPYYHDDLRDALAVYGDGEGYSMVKLSGGHLTVDGKSVGKSQIAKALGKPDAKVKIVPGQVYVNGKSLCENYAAEDSDKVYPNGLTPRQWTITDKDGSREVKIPKGRLLVMGDNRNFSDDARRWGLLDRSRIRGKAMFVFYPVGRVRWIH